MKNKTISTKTKELKNIFLNAESAFTNFSKTSISKRIQLLTNLQNVIAEKQNEIAARIHAVVGKNETEALLTEVLPTLAFIKDYRRNLPKYLKTEKVAIPFAFLGIKARTELRPSGVALIISPWNFPFYLAMAPLITAVSAGNTAILKPSEVSPDIGTLCAELFAKAGFPKNTVQIAYGKGDVANSLIYMRPSRIFFTGSTAVGRLIGKAAGELIIPCLLELGGKSPMLVFADCNLERAANAAVFGAFCNAGQVCVAASRIYVADKIYDDFVSKALTKTLALPKEDLGKIAQPQHTAYLKSLITDALQKGAKQLCGHLGTKDFSPVILADTKENMQIMQAETFGPVMAIARFSGKSKDALALANNSDYGLSASVFTKNRQKATRIAAGINAGNININDVIQSVAIPSLPFGGIKQSGIGRYHGKKGLEFFSDEISIASSPQLFPSAMTWLPYSSGLKKHLENIIDGLYGSGSKLAFIKSALALFLRNFRE